MGASILPPQVFASEPKPCGGNNIILLIITITIIITIMKLKLNITEDINGRGWKTVEATHITSNSRSGKLGTVNEEEEEDDDDYHYHIQI